jgi:hypothetical protein
MNIYCVKGVAAYHEFACAMRAVCPTVPDGMWTGYPGIYLGERNLQQSVVFVIIL